MLNLNSYVTVLSSCLHVKDVRGCWIEGACIERGSVKSWGLRGPFTSSSRLQLMSVLHFLRRPRNLLKLDRTFTTSESAYTSLDSPRAELVRKKDSIQAGLCTDEYEGRNTNGIRYRNEEIACLRYNKAGYVALNVFITVMIMASWARCRSRRSRRSHMCLPMFTTSSNVPCSR